MHPPRAAVSVSPAVLSVDHLEPCQEEQAGTCSKEYPKTFQEETENHPDSGYPLYRRPRHGNIGTTPQGQRVDSSWVVPYNPYLLLLLDAHCNVEICSSIKAVKYLFKYMLKGTDRVNVVLRHEPLQQGEEEKKVAVDPGDNGRNEVEDYLNARYLTPPEAMWRLLSLPIQKNSHTIVRLAVHLEGQQTVYFETGTEEKVVEDDRRTKLTAWFELNKHDPQAHQYLYHDIPCHYVWHRNGWHARKSMAAGKKVISR